MSRLEPYRFAGRTAVLTGAASGIGEQLAHQLAAKGSHLVLLDRDADRLAGVAEAVRAQSPAVDVEPVVVDLGDRAAALATAERVAREHPRVGLLVNNAGVALGGRFDEVSLDDFEWLMDINFRAAVVLTHTLLPALLAEPGSHLVNTSSVFGLFAPAGQTAYSSSKFALRGLSQSLRAELGPRGVGVTTVHPGGVRTRVAENARVAAGADAAEVERGKAAMAALLTYPASKAAAEILAGVERRKGRVLISVSATLPDVVARALPVAHPQVIDWVSRSLAKRGARRRPPRTTQATVPGIAGDAGVTPPPHPAGPAGAEAGAEVRA